MTDGKLPNCKTCKKTVIWADAGILTSKPYLYCRTCKIEVDFWGYELKAPDPALKELETYLDQHEILREPEESTDDTGGRGWGIFGMPYSVTKNQMSVGGNATLKLAGKKISAILPLSLKDDYEAQCKKAFEELVKTVGIPQSMFEGDND